jgi:hypothetical protein
MTITALPEQDKERARYHLGYLETSLAASIQLGIPRPLQTVFLLEQGLNLLVNPFAVSRVVCILDTLDRLESQLISAAAAVGVDKLGNLQLHPLRTRGKLGTDSVEDEYRRWAYRLSDILGVPIYPYSKRFRRAGPGSSIGVSNT